MLTSPWDLILTVLFSATGLWCAIDLVVHRAKSRTAEGAMTPHTLVDINHLVMSVAMILMIWVTVIDVVTWAQVAIFAIFVLALLPSAFARNGVVQRISAIGHVALNAAMIWMLLAMPVLMAGMTMGEGDSSGHHHGGDVAAMPASTPMWAIAVNVLFVSLSAAAAAWWIAALLRRQGRRLHDACYAGMAIGMSLMLTVMSV